MARLDWTPPQITEYAEFQYNVDYAAEVHELTGNRWTDRGLNGSNLPDVMASEYASTQDLIQAFKNTAEYLGERFQNEAPVNSGKLKASFNIEWKNL
jgi:hypothetical protein